MPRVDKRDGSHAATAPGTLALSGSVVRDLLVVKRGARFHVTPRGYGMPWFVKYLCEVAREQARDLGHRRAQDAGRRLRQGETGAATKLSRLRAARERLL